jgi:threonyl-tRNA synthetase
VELQPGQGAFYGPKLEFVLSDRLGRQWQCGTIQVDLVMPRRFEVRYTDRSGERHHVVMLHRALYGSLERFLGILLEQHGAQLPAWFAPEQVYVLPVGPEQRPQARVLLDQLVARGLRASLDEREETLGKRIASAHEAGIPFLAILGAREVQSGAVALRARSNQRVLPADVALTELASACAVPG